MSRMDKPSEDVPFEYANKSQYTCAECGRTFPREQTNEDAMQEYKDQFPHDPEEDLVLVCDECYDEILATDQAQQN
jgi:DNA-directed RNA polymerase subunit RPC12/RpoP